MSEEDIDYIKGHEKAINDPAPGDFFRSNPEKIRAITERERESFYKKLDIHNKRFHSLIPYVQRTRVYTKLITDKTKFAACFLLFHKAIQTWEAMVTLSKLGFYYEVMELSRSTGENMDLANMFILSDKDDVYLNRWFTGEIIGNRHARESFEGVFNGLEVLPEAIPLAKTLSEIYGTMSSYTHGAYSVLLEMINIFTKDFDFDKSTGFHRLDEESDVLKNLVNKIHYSLIFFYMNLAKDETITDELLALVPEPVGKMSTEEIKKHYEKYRQNSQNG